jgi:hypothetical protein
MTEAEFGVYARALRFRIGHLEGHWRFFDLMIPTGILHEHWHDNGRKDRNS